MKGSVAMSMAVMLAVLVQLFTAMPGEAAVSCGQLESSMLPCSPYIIPGGNPTSACCESVKNAISISNVTPEDKRTACNCFKAAAAKNPNFKPEIIVPLLKSCGIQVNLPFPDAKNIDCNKIN